MNSKRISVFCFAILMAALTGCSKTEERKESPVPRTVEYDRTGGTLWAIGEVLVLKSKQLQNFFLLSLLGV